MSKYYYSAGVMCPYYRGEKSTLVRCDGWKPEAVTHIAFEERTAARAYKLRYCRSGYESCAIFQRLAASYIDN